MVVASVLHTRWRGDGLNTLHECLGRKFCLNTLHECLGSKFCLNTLHECFARKFCLNTLHKCLHKLTGRVLHTLLKHKAWHSEKCWRWNLNLNFRAKRDENFWSEYPAKTWSVTFGKVLKMKPLVIHKCLARCVIWIPYINVWQDALSEYLTSMFGKMCHLNTLVRRKAWHLEKLKDRT